MKNEEEIKREVMCVSAYVCMRETERERVILCYRTFMTETYKPPFGLSSS